MGRATSEKVGRGSCTHVGCGEPVTYRKSSGGMLTWKCDGCDSSGYAQPGGTRYAACMATIKPTPAAGGASGAPSPAVPAWYKTTESAPAPAAPAPATAKPRSLLESL